MAEAGRINVFYSYSHKDEAYRDGLVDALSALRADGTISEWHDRLITPASDWQHEIERNLEHGHIVLFLISPDFMASKYCRGVEVKQAVDLHWQRRCRIVPVIVRPTPNWTDSPIGSFQALPRDAKPICTWAQADTAFADICEGLRKVCKEIVDWDNPYRRSNVGDWVAKEQTIVGVGQRAVARIVIIVETKNDTFATLTFKVHSQGKDTPITLRVPLDKPLEDNLQEILKQGGDQLPPNAQLYREEAGRGEQKLLIGGKPYYCQWVGHKVTMEVDTDRLVTLSKEWRCIDVPMDGKVKDEVVCRTDAGEKIYRTSTLLLAYGRGG